jgi:hypothetical protein
LSQTVYRSATTRIVIKMKFYPAALCKISMIPPQLQAFSYSPTTPILRRILHRTVMKVTPTFARQTKRAAPSGAALVVSPADGPDFS